MIFKNTTQMMLLFLITMIFIFQQSLQMQHRLTYGRIGLSEGIYAYGAVHGAKKLF